MTSASDLAELLMGQALAHATIVGVVETDRVPQVCTALRRTLESVDPECEMAREMLQTYIDVLTLNGEPAPAGRRGLRLLGGGRSE